MSMVISSGEKADDFIDFLYREIVSRVMNCMVNRCRAGQNAFMLNGAVVVNQVSVTLNSSIDAKVFKVMG